MEHIIGGKLVHPQEVHLGLELGQFGHKLVQLLFGWLIEVSEALGGNLAVKITTGATLLTGSLTGVITLLTNKSDSAQRAKLAWLMADA